MRQTSRILQIDTSGRGFYEFTEAVRDFARGARMTQGLATAFCRHTSASLLIQENADPTVLRVSKPFRKARARRRGLRP
jgi:thiamine phosphate synthase YjbQ (UPF0047 family)